MENKIPQVVENRIPHLCYFCSETSEQERRVVRHKMYEKIQRLKRRGESISEISRRLSLDRKTAAKYFHMDGEEYRRYCRSVAYREKGFDEHEADILAVYRENGFRRLNVAALYDYLEERFGKLRYTEKTLRNYIHYLQECGKLEISERVRMFMKVPELPFGRQLQVDFGQWKCESGLTLYIFSAVLSASRYKFMLFQNRPLTTEDVIVHLIECFDHIGGIPEEVVIDQDALLVVAENAGEILYTRKFATFIDEMGFSMYVCRAADPQSKGKVENTIKYVKHNFLELRDFEHLDEANTALRRWLARRANGKLSQATRRAPGELLEAEREQLLPLRNSIFARNQAAGREQRLVNEHSYISVAGSLYSVPSKYRNRTVQIYLTSEKLFIFEAKSGIELAEHSVAAIPGSTVSTRAHFRMTERSVKELVAEARALVDLPLWRGFVKRNAEAFPRYVRDQAIEAKRYFSGEIDSEALSEALEFCMEYETFSFASLHDTYQSFLGHTGESTEQRPAPMLLDLPKVEVSRRSLSAYRCLIAQRCEGAGA